MRKESEKQIREAVEAWNLFRRGDDKAFSFLFSTFSDVLFRYGTKFVEDEELVKDCIQELFIKIFETRSTLPDTDNVKFFLFKSLKNKIIDALREEKKTVCLPPEELQFSIEYSFNPEDEDGEDNDVMEKFKTILNSLSSRQKEAVYLRYQMGLSYEEISQLLNIKYQSARNLIHRSIEQIRKELRVES